MNKLNRRQLLRASMFGGVGMLAAACSSQAEPAQRPVPTEAQPQGQPAAQPTAAPAVSEGNAAYPSSTAAPITKNPSSTNAATNTELAASITSAANQFLNALTDDQRAKATYAFTDAERLRWHWTNPSGFPRNGLPLKDMQPNQHENALALLRASISEAGFQKAMNLMSLMSEVGGDPQNYWTTVFGKPGDPTWGWRFEGHHLSRHFTLQGDKITVTPFFHGAWPTVSSAGLRAMQREEWAARELVKSLDETKLAEVVFQKNALTRHVTWNDAYVKPLDPVGAPLSALNNDQQALAQEIIQTWLGSLAEPVAKAHLDRINAAGLDAIRFGWAGSMEERRPHYYRLQGPSFLLEYDNTRNGGIHIHSVWRVFDQDFGQGLV
jgi:Protein of unknown function (DUF3500)